VALGPTVGASPGFSTLDFPMGDIRANNVTMQLGGNGTLQAVFVAASGARTQLVFDVTGYYGPGPGGSARADRPGPIGLGSCSPGPARGHSDRAGYSSKLGYAVIRGFSVASAVPVGAVAVSGTATITWQTAAGFIALAPTLSWPLPTSTLNFPYGDTRANGQVVPITSTRGLAVCLGGTVRGTTQFVFDLTGYFIPIT
jgi:hypothetical protein